MPKQRPQPRQGPRKTVAYVRASTEEQSLTLTAQEARIRAYCAATDRNVDSVVADPGYSAKTLTDRPGMQRIIASIRSGEVGTVIVQKLDRLTRSVYDLGELMSLFATEEAALIVVSESIDTSTASGRMVMNIMASVAQWEREAIAERTKAVLAHKRGLRQVYGATPYGYRRTEDRLLSNPREQRGLALMKSRFEQGATYRAIAAELASSGFRPRGTVWHPNTVRRILHTCMTREAVA